ncbi:type I polyketide synthase [Nocardia sp. NPDC051321]|uniref:type I polyketide synthase n=1 Tax=Nocardia sp. NPDC051321 TaxID=3364323 RepID=UPI003798C2E7
MTDSREEKIAVIGMGCRFPGAERGPAGFWSLLSDGRDAVRPFPPDRLGQFYHPDPDRTGRTHASAGSFLDNVEDFDADFFGIAPREARSIDPMFRMLLETTWEALEDAGQPADQLAGSKTGVFVGVSSTDFLNLQIWAGAPEMIEAYTGPGTLHGMASGRLAHALDLQGPALSLDTACSSSLVALHLAAASLRRGECDMALVGGVSLLLSPDIWINLSLAKMIAADGRCKTFDAGADGYGRGEGCGVLVLRRLHDVSDGERVLAVLRGSAVKHDGRSASIIAPNGAAQRAVIREALAAACVTPDEVGYVEAHGTGTPLGDAIELDALGDVFGPLAGRELLVGSVKTNIGHLEAAAGMAGLIKTILCFENGIIAPHLNLKELNPRIRLHGSRIRIPTAPDSWPSGGPLIAGVSSFGLSGTNAHVVLEAPARERDVTAPAAMTPDRPAVITVSARTDIGLRKLAAGYHRALEADRITLPDLARTVNAGRAHFAHRGAVVALDPADAAAQLAELTGTATDDARPARIAFLYSGQGSHRAGTGQELYRVEPIFRAALDRCAEAMEEHLDIRLLEVLFGSGTLLDHTEYAQPALFAFEYASTALWESMGVRPDAVLGHSVGAYAAACAAGVFDLDTAARLVATRGRLMRHTSPGAMYAVVAGVDVVRDAIGEHADRVTVAAVNGPAAVTISGAESALAEVVSRLSGAGVPTRRLPVTRGFHSALMDPMLAEFEQQVARAVTHAPHTAFVSDLTGEFADSTELSEPSYWRRHVREPVRFAAGVRTLVDAGCPLMVEIGPAGVLAGFVRRGVEHANVHAVAAMVGAEPEPERVQRALAALYTRGARIDWAQYHRDRPGRIHRAPTYPFESVTHSNKFVERGRRTLARLAQSATPGSSAELTVPYAGAPVWLPSGAAVFEQILGENHPADNGDHRLFGRVVVPGAYWLSAAAGSTWHLANSAADLEFSDVVFTRPLVLAGEQQHRAQCHLTPTEPDTWAVEVHSAPAEDGRPQHWSIHARTKAALCSSIADEPPESARPDDAMDGAEFYAEAARRGLQLSGSFRWIRWVRPGSRSTRFMLGRPDGVAADVVAAPGFVDACFQAIAGALPDAVIQELTDQGNLLVPLTVRRVVLARRPVAAAWGDIEVLEIAQRGGYQVLADIRVYDEHGLVLLLEGVRLTTIKPEQVGLADPDTVCRYDIQWRPGSPPQPAPHPARTGAWLVWSTRNSLSDRILELLAERGEPCAVISAVDEGWELCHPDGGRQRLDITDPDHWRTLGEAPWRGVLYLSALDLLPLEPAADEPSSTANSLVRELVPLLNGWTTTEGGPVWLITRGAQQVAREPIDPRQSTVWGLGRTLATENPLTFGGLVDLDPSGSVTGEAAALVDLLLSSEHGVQQAHRADSWLTPRLVELDRTHSDATVPIRPDASYLITGGLGGVGLAIARWLIAQGAGTILLNGRSELTGQGRAAIAALAAGPADVHYVRGDVADPRQAVEIVERIRREFPPLRGLVHAAGVLDDALLHQQSWPQVAAVLGPKVDGGWHLHRATAASELDFFLLCSSIAGALGSPGQSGYAAANTFLDGLAQYRRANGLPAVSIAWGPWAGDGMVADSATAERLTAVGLRPMPPQAAVAALGRAFCDDRAVLAVLDADWQRWQRIAGGRIGAGLLGDLLNATAGTDNSGASAAGYDTTLIDLADLLDADPAQRIERISIELRARLAQTLDTAPERVALNTPLTALGLDSLMGLELKNRIESAFSIRVPTALILRGPTLRELAEHVADQLATPAAVSRDNLAPETLLGRLDELSDTELDTLLAEYADDAEIDGPGQIIGSQQKGHRA